jgi:small-conductance mechanosensitive channel
MPDLSPEAFWERYRAEMIVFLTRLGTSLVIFVVFWLVGSAVQRLVARAVQVRSHNPDLVLFLGRSAKLILIAFGLVTALATLGVDVTALVAGLGLVGFALGFALKDMISNALAGVLILLYKPFHRGDLITVDPNQGVVVEINLRYTVLHTEELRILIPNSTLFTNVVKVSTKAPGEPVATPAPATPPAADGDKGTGPP